MAQVHPEDYAGSAQKDLEDEKNFKIEKIQRGGTVSPVNPQKHIDNALSATETENCCIIITSGPLYQVEKDDCCQVGKLKAFLTFTKFVLSFASIILIARTVEVKQGTIQPACFTGVYVLLGWNLTRVAYVLLVTFCSVKGVNFVAGQLFCGLILRGWQEISCNCKSNTSWYVLKVNIALFMAYYSACIILYISIGACTSSLMTFKEPHGMNIFFLILGIYALNLVIEVRRFFKLKSEYA